MNTQDALYQIIDWLENQSIQSSQSIEADELTQIKELIAQSIEIQEVCAQKTADAVQYLVNAINEIDDLSANGKPAYIPPASQLARTAHKSLLSWLLDTLTRVSGDKASTVVAVLRPLTSTDNRQPQFVGCQLLSVEGVAPSSFHESAIDLAAFAQPLDLGVPTYLVCHRKAHHTWEAQIRTKAGADKTSMMLFRQNINH